MRIKPITLYGNAQVELDEKGSPIVIAADRLEWLCDHDPVKNIDLIFRDPIMFYHYFHFCELAVAAFTMIAIYMPAVRIRRIYVGSQQWNNENQNFVQEQIMRALFRPDRIVEGAPQGEEAFSEFLIDIDRFGPGHGEFNKYLEAFLVQTKRVFPILRDRVLEFAEAKSHCNVELHPAPMLYVKRAPPRTFGPGVEERVLAAFDRRGLVLEPIDFATMDWKEQVRATSRARLLVGIHGNGLTNCLWMPKGATVVEFFPAGVHQYDYQIFSEAAGLSYFGFEGRPEPGFLYTSGSRVGEPYGDVYQPVMDLPWRWLDEALDTLV